MRRGRAPRDRAGDPERIAEDEDRGPDQREVGEGQAIRGRRQRPVKPFEEPDPLGGTRQRDQLADRAEPGGGIAQILWKFEEKCVAQVVGQLLGPGALSEQPGERPGVDRIIRPRLGVERNDPIQCLDRLPVPSRPRQGQRVVVFRRRILRVALRQVAERLDRRVQVAEIARPQPFIPRGPPFRIGGARNRYGVVACGGKFGAFSRRFSASSASAFPGSIRNAACQAAQAARGRRVRRKSWPKAIRAVTSVVVKASFLNGSASGHVKS